MYNVDVALLQMKIAEGALYPTLAAVGNVRKSWGGTAVQLATIESLQASLAAHHDAALSGRQIEVTAQGKLCVVGTT
jgi:hypothetical protein